MSSNNEKSNIFEAVGAFMQGIAVIASGGAAAPSTHLQTQKPNCSIVEQQESEAQKQYELLPEIVKTPELEEQLETMAEIQESERREQGEEELETSLIERNSSKTSGSPDPEPESEEGEWVSEYMKDLQSRIESGTLILKSPEEQSEREVGESETDFEFESEFSESETESESESQSEMKWG